MFNYFSAKKCKRNNNAAYKHRCTEKLIKKNSSLSLIIVIKNYHEIGNPLSCSIDC